MTKALYSHSATATEAEVNRLRKRVEELRGRIELAQTVLADLPTLPDAGKHEDPNCYIYHRDCLIVRLRNTLKT